VSVNLELVQSIYAAWERGDYSSARWADPEIEYVHADGPSPGHWKGLDALATGAREWLNAWEEYRHEAEEYRELDDQRVLVLIRWSGRGRTSGLDLGQMRTKGAHVFHVRRGRVTKFVVYFERDHALADLGLAPEAGSARS
jgi:ketosteroid isomerase-like protein